MLEKMAAKKYLIDIYTENHSITVRPSFLVTTLLALVELRLPA
jgi:hypothetical protein